MIIGLLRSISSMGRARKRSVMIAYDLCAMALALWAAFSTRLGELYFPGEPVVMLAAAISFAIGIFALYKLRVYHLVLRYFHLEAVSRLFAASAIAATAWVILVYLTRAQFEVDGIMIF